MNKRLDSLDALRGFDLILLVVFEEFLWKLRPAVDASWFDSLMQHFTHKDWQGFSFWDLVMPLFMFMSGATIPYSLAKYRNGTGREGLYRRLARRFLLLWLLGMVCQGNLLGLDPQRIYLFSNTLQAIAVGYIFAAIIFLNGVRTLPGERRTIGGYGGGNYTPEGNLAEIIDRWVLGRFRDGAQVVDGAVVFANGYNYTWILSSLNFIVTVMTGVFAGEILKSSLAQRRKLVLLFAIGIAMALCGWFLNGIHPVIKRIWTSSMVLVSSGYCFLLTWLFYYWIDCRGHRCGLTLLKIYGMNSITAYVVSLVINFSSVSHSLLHGLETYVGAYYPALLMLSNAAIVFVILLILYRNKIFLRV